MILYVSLIGRLSISAIYSLTPRRAEYISAQIRSNLLYSSKNSSSRGCNILTFQSKNFSINLSITKKINRTVEQNESSIRRFHCKTAAHHQLTAAVSHL